MTKNKAIELAEKFRALALQATEPYDRIIFFNTAGQYYLEAGQYNMVVWCRNQT